MFVDLYSISDKTYHYQTSRIVESTRLVVIPRVSGKTLNEQKSWISTEIKCAYIEIMNTFHTKNNGLWVHNTYWVHCAYATTFRVYARFSFDIVGNIISRLGNLVTGFMISDESGNRFFPTAVTDYWQDQGCLSARGPTKTLNIGIIIDVYGGDC